MGKGFHESMLKAFTKDSSKTFSQHSQGTHTALATHSQSTHILFTKHSHNFHAHSRTNLTTSPRGARRFFRPRTHEPERGGKGRGANTNPTPEACFREPASTSQNAEGREEERPLI